MMFFAPYSPLYAIRLRIIAWLATVVSWFRVDHAAMAQRAVERRLLVQYLHDRASAWHDNGWPARAEICMEIAEDIEQGAP